MPTTWEIPSWYEYFLCLWTQTLYLNRRLRTRSPWGFTIIIWSILWYTLPFHLPDWPLHLSWVLCQQCKRSSIRGWTLICKRYISHPLGTFLWHAVAKKVTKIFTKPLRPDRGWEQRTSAAPVSEEKNVNAGRRPFDLNLAEPRTNCVVADAGTSSCDG